MRGKVVLITGASSGIGAGTALHLASKGCRLSLTGRSVQGLENTLAKCLQAGAKGQELLLIPADLDEEADVRRVVASTLQQFGQLDVLVNNAGVWLGKEFLDTTLADFDRVMRTNVRAVFLLTQLAMPHLLRARGSVVNVSSVSSLRPFAKETVYGMSKAALDHFTRTLALEMAPQGVRVNAVNPGDVPTNVYRDTDFAMTPELVKAFHALGRGGTVEEIARAISFLADDDQSSFVTGVTLPVDGGCALVGPTVN